jgi:hypothetical protein
MDAVRDTAALGAPRAGSSRPFVIIFEKPAGSSSVLWAAAKASAQ